MKTLVLLSVFLLGVSNVTAQFSHLNEFATYAVLIDPNASIKEKNPDLTFEIEAVNLLVEHFYIKGDAQLFPDLRGTTYIDYGTEMGLSGFIDRWEKHRVYLGVRGNQIWRGGYMYGSYGLGGGYDFYISDKVFFRLSGKYEYRTDAVYSGADPYWRFSGGVGIGARF